MPRAAHRPDRNEVGSDEATIMERNVGAPASTRAGSDEATVMETLDLHRGADRRRAEVERRRPPPKRRCSSARSAVIVRAEEEQRQDVHRHRRGVAIVLGGGVLLHGSASRLPTPVTTGQHDAVVTTTAPTSNRADRRRKGALLLSASPWGELDKIVDDEGQAVDITEKTNRRRRASNSIPESTRSHVRSERHVADIDVTVEAGNAAAACQETFDSSVNFDELEKEVAKP